MGRAAVSSRRLFSVPIAFYRRAKIFLQLEAAMIDENADSIMKLFINWQNTGDAEFIYRATDPQGRKLIVRLNDFPGEPLYTLLCESEPIESFDDWPKNWSRS